MAAIVSVAAALPATCVTNDDLAQTLDTSDAWIASRTGIRQRFVLGADESFLDLCVDAAARAAGAAGGGVDFVLVATTTPASDFGDAAAVGAALAARGLAAPGCGGLDVRSACCGFVDALGVARALVGGGAATRCVVVAGDALSGRCDARDRSTAVLFGDGAGAAVVAASPTGAFRATYAATDASDALALAAGGPLRMDGKAVYALATRRAPAAVRAALDDAGWDVAGVATFVFHQANARILEEVAAALGLRRDQCPCHVSAVANCGAASTAILLANVADDLRAGDRVVLCAFGAGFKVSVACVSWAAKCPSDVAAARRPATDVLRLPAVADAATTVAGAVRAALARACRVEGALPPLAALAPDSLACAEFAATLEEALGRTVPTTLLLDHATLPGLVAAVEGLAAPEVAAPQKTFAATAAQHGMLFHHLSDPGGRHFVEVFRFDVAETVRVDDWRRAWRDVVARRDALRATFDFGGDAAPTMTVHDAVDADAVFLEDDTEEALAAAGAAGVAAALDGGRAPLVRAGLAGGRCVVAIHHLVTDGASTKLLLEDVAAAYAGAPPPKVDAWAAYAASALAAADPLAVAAHEAAVGWVAGAAPPRRRRNKPRRKTTTLPVAGAVDAAASTLGVPPAALVHASFAVALGGDDVAYGATVACRDFGRHCVGPALVSLPTRLDVRGSLGDVARASMENLAALRRVAAKAAASTLCRPLDVLFDYQGGEDTWTSAGGLLSGGALEDRAGVDVSARCLRSGGAYVLTVVSEGAAAPGPLLGAFARVLEAVAASAGSDPSVALVRLAAAPRAARDDDDDDDDEDDEDDEEDAAAVDDASPAAATPTEAALAAAVAAEVGGAAGDVDVRANVFALGLDSLGAMRAVARAVALGAPRSLSLRVLFAAATVRGAAGAADAGAGGAVDLDVLGGAGVIAHARGPFPLLRSACAGAYDVYPLFGVGAAHFVGLHASSVTGSPVSPQIYWEWDFPGGLDVDAFAAAWDALVARHGTLRAHVGADGAMRSWRDAATFAGRVAVRVGAARGAFREDFCGAGDAIGSVHEWPLFAVGASFDGGRATAHVAMSLFLMDAVSDLTFRAELSGAYECLQKGGAVVFPTPAPALAFGDYSRSLVAGLPESRAYLLAKKHWAKKLEDPAFPRRGPAIPRRADVEAHTPASPAFVNQTSTVSGAAWADCRAACRARGVTAPVALLATYCLALCRHVEDASANGRRFLLNVLLCLRYDVDEDAFRCLGNCSSTVLVDVDLRNARTFGEACGALRASLAESLEHSAMSGVEVMALLNRERASTFEAAAPFVFTTPVGVEKSLPRAEDAARDWCFEETFFSERVPHTACVNAVKDAPGAPAGDEPALFCSLDVVDGAFPGAVAAELKRSYAFLLREALCGDWDADVWAAADAALSGAYPVAAPPYAATPEPPAGTLLQDALERRVGDTEQTALLCVEDDEARPLRRFSFAEVLSRSRACASLLRGLGLAPGFLGAVVMAKGWRQVVAVHAILFEAGAYVPCDAALWPAGRVRAVVSRSGAAVCLVDGAAPADLGGAPAVTVTDFERDEPETAWPPRGAARAAPARAKPEDAAYVIYTSGSTGLPKGVVCHHRGALNTIEDLRARWGLGDRDVLLGLASLAFDLSVFDVFGSALCGAALALPRAADLSPPDPDAWLRLCDRAGVTVWNSVPALLDLAVSGLELRDGTLPRALRVAFLSGDVVPAGLPARAYDRSPTVRVVLMGGATEAAIWSNEFPVERPGRLPAGWGGWPYGRPMSNQTMSILSDATLEPLPPYVVGVIHIGGVGVMTGYRGDDEKNKRSLRTRARDGRRFFRTGDLGRMRLCGGDWVLEILGREDGQAKVRGFRVELGEIEAAMTAHPKVRAAACAVVDGGGAIEAHVVLRTAGGLDAKLEAALRATLARSLPTYAVPRAFGAVAALPLSPNGKVDRSRLPPLRRRAAVAAADEAAPPEPPATALERAAVAAFAAASGVDAAAICAATGHFFRVLGGTSLAALKCLRLLTAATSAKLSVRDLLEHATPRAIAARAAAAGAAGFAGPAATYEALPLGDGSAGKPTLVLLNPAGATALCYGALARRLAGRARVVGLDDGVVAGREPALAHASIAEAARAAAAATKSLAGDAPLILGGWSYGGVVAVEAARLLGDAVAGVALFDAPVAGAVVASADLGDASPAAAAHFAAATELLVSYYGSDRAPLDLPALDALPADSEDPRRGDRASLLPRRTAARVPGSHWTMLADDAALDAVVDAVARWVAGL